MVFDVGGNVLAIAVILGQIGTAYIAYLARKMAADTNNTVKKELTTDDGSTLRDATDRIESALGTTPALPVDKQHYDATDGSHGKEPPE